MIPDFVIPGGQKCGTTALKVNLEQHPNVFFPGKGNEVHFFDKRWGRGVEWYESLYDGRGDKTKGDKTPVYMYLPDYVERMRDTLPSDTKIVVCLRNPIDRALSQFAHHKRNGAPLSLEKYLALEMDRIDEPPTEDTAPTDFLRRGLYAGQVEMLQWCFDDIYYVITERMYENTEGVTNEVLGFLGLEAIALPNPHRKRRVYEVDPAIERGLREFFAPNVEKVFELIGFTVEEWGF